jgi:BASS family bile acid:Na+ symporter
MTLQSAIQFGLTVSIMATVLAVGLEADWADMTSLFRKPGKLIRSLLAMDVAMPAFVVLLIALTHLPGPVKIALVALSVSPVPPALPKKAIKTGGSEEYIVGLLVAASVIAFVFVPLAVEGLGRYFGVDMHAPLVTIVWLMAKTVLVPLVAGIAVHRLAPGFAGRVSGPLAKVAGILLLLCALPVVITQWAQARSLVHDGTLVALVLFVLVGLAVGHLLGGPEPDDRTILAMATSSRHPGVAIAIATASFPGQKLTIAAVILYLIVNALISIPYMQWRKRVSVSF